MKHEGAGDDAGREVFDSENSRTSGEPLMRIGDMAKEFDVTLRTLRFYEDKGLLSPHREGSTRLYSRRDRARLKLILLGRRIGFSLRDVKQIIDLYNPSGSNLRQLKLGLEKSEKQMARLKKQQADIAGSIVELDTLMDDLKVRLGDRSPRARAVS